MENRNEQGRFVRGNPGSSGRPIGSKNKFTLLKERLIDLVGKLDEECGGPNNDWLLEMAKKHPTDLLGG